MAKGNHVAPFHKLLSSPSPGVYHLYNPKKKTVNVVLADSIHAFVNAHYNIGRNQITTSSNLPPGYEDFACVYNLEPDVDGKFSTFDTITGAAHVEHTGPSLKKMGLRGNSQQEVRAAQHRERIRREHNLLGKLGLAFIEDHLGPDAPSLFPTSLSAPSIGVDPALISPTPLPAKAKHTENTGGKVVTEKKRARVAPTDGIKGKKLTREKKKAAAEVGMNTPPASPPSITTAPFVGMIPISPDIVHSTASSMNTNASGELLNAVASSSAVTLADDINMVDAPEEWELDMYLGTVVDSTNSSA
ncbi:hypothetical protein CCMSSC00406_0000545 [Pleurotus cornucopiae]|uniref:Uncharacterized protein n=1 Tax=Pleurotus cornucopiae TaxID=5321 RepID=A0ACB7JCI1_PLECO|nr:hypothetical protein CCMSSC00406_0000545 [Pleurotus cornucopiae]